MCPAPTWDSRTKWRVSERQTVKELGADAVDVPVYYIRQTLLSLWSETVALYSDPLTPVLSHVASINVSSNYEVIKVRVGKPGYKASELEQAVFVLVCSSLALESCVNV